MANKKDLITSNSIFQTSISKGCTPQILLGPFLNNLFHIENIRRFKLDSLVRLSQNNSQFEEKKQNRRSDGQNFTNSKFQFS